MRGGRLQARQAYESPFNRLLSSLPLGPTSPLPLHPPLILLLYPYHAANMLPNWTVENSTRKG